MQEFNEVFELYQRIAQLPPANQFYLVELVLSGIRKTHFAAHDAIQREIAELANGHAQRQTQAGRVEGAEREAG